MVKIKPITAREYEKLFVITLGVIAGFALYKIAQNLAKSNWDAYPIVFNDCWGCPEMDGSGKTESQIDVIKPDVPHSC